MEKEHMETTENKLQGTRISTYWWRSLSGKPIPETHHSELENWAETVIAERSRHGYREGELTLEIEGTHYRGWWSQSVQKPGTELCEYIPVSRIVPTSWVEWFWELISESAPFSWGDSNRTLVEASRFRKHCASCLSDAPREDRTNQEEIDNFLESLSELGDTYLDLEN